MILAGNMEMMAENKISFNQDITEKAEGFLAQGCTVIYVAFDGILAGFLALSDTVRVEVLYDQPASQSECRTCPSYRRP